MRRHAAVKPALLLVLLRCGRSLGAFVLTRSNPCKSALQDPSRRHCCCCASSATPLSPSSGTRVPILPESGGRSAAAGVRRPSCVPAAAHVGQGLAQKTRCYAVHGTRGISADGRTGYYGAEANGRELLASQQQGGGTGAGGEEAGGFGWLREFGNGKMDIAGLVLSTVLLMTAAAPLGVAADMKVANGRGLDQSRQNEPTEVRLRADNAPQVPRPVEAGVSDAASVPSTAVRTKHSNRVSALKLGGEAPKRPRVAPFSGVGSRVTAVDEGSQKIGTLAQEAENTRLAARGVADWARGVALRTQSKDSSSTTPRVADATEPALRTELPPLTTGKPTPSTSSGSFDKSGSVLSPGKGGTSTVLNSLSADATRLKGQGEEIREELQSELLEKLESEHEELFGESLPVPTMPESFNRAFRKTLPALIPPAMAVFLTVSMPAVILLLKGVGTTLVAVAKGYGKGDRGRSGDGDGTGAVLEVGFRSGGNGGGGGEKRRGHSTETPGSTFQMFLGGGDRGGVEASGGVNGNGVKGSRRMPVDGSSPLESAASAAPFPVQQVATERHGFFNKSREKHPKSTTGGRETAAAGVGGGGGGRGNNDVGGGFAVGDDAMAAMAMAAMTQELNVMKQSLQTEVQTMRKDLELASEDSRRLTEKLFRLEEDNRQLQAMVSRLGGQDARKLKAQLFSLLASPSMGQPGDSSSFPQLTPA